jgi:hypothetical protein
VWDGVGGGEVDGGVWGVGEGRFDETVMSVGATVKGVVNFTAGDEDSMRIVVGLHQPVSVAFEVPGPARPGPLRLLIAASHGGCT